MKKFLSLLALMICATAAQAQTVTAVQAYCTVQVSVTGTGRAGGPAASPTSGFDNRARGCFNWTLQTTVTGFSAISATVQDAPDSSGVAGAWETFTGTVISGSNPVTTITQSTLVLQGFFPWMGINVTSVTGSGTITFSFQGQQRVPPGTSSLIPGYTIEALTTSGGQANFSLQPAASDNHQTIKNGAGQVYSISAFSIHTTFQNVRLYDAGTGFNGCNSATNLLWAGIVPGAATGDGFSTPAFEGGLPFVNGLSLCYTGGYGNTDTTVATASVSVLNVGYK